MKKSLRLFFIVIPALFFMSCAGGYSFTGASISPNVKTISIAEIPNRARLVQPLLSSLFSEALREKFSSGTSLSVVDYDGDLDIKGEITDYSLTAASIQSDDKAARNILRISVQITFTNKTDEKANFSQRFSRERGYDSSLDLSEVEESLIDEINKELVEDIFNKAVVNW